MIQETSLQSLSDDELLQRLSELLSQSRRTESDLIAHIAEVDERRLYLGRGSSSMFHYATEVLHLSEAEAYLRITAARASREYPVLLDMLRDGRLHLSGIGKLVPHLTRENYQGVLFRASHKSKRRIEELVAEISPRPDAPGLMRKLPERSPSRLPSPLPEELRPDGVHSGPTTEPAHLAPARSVAAKSCSHSRPTATPVVEPLAPERYRVQFTASRELRDKLERLQTLMDAGLAEAIDVAVTEKLERLEAKRFAATKTPRKTLAETNLSARSRYIPAAVKRAVRTRDGDRCRFLNDEGRRCTERRGLEFHHHEPYGQGGTHDPDNISLVCRRHNAYMAERDYGKAVVAKYRNHNGGGRVSEPIPIYSQ